MCSPQPDEGLGQLDDEISDVATQQRDEALAWVELGTCADRHGPKGPFTGLGRTSTVELPIEERQEVAMVLWGNWDADWVTFWLLTAVSYGGLAWLITLALRAEYAPRTLPSDAREFLENNRPGPRSIQRNTGIRSMHSQRWEMTSAVVPPRAVERSASGVEFMSPEDCVTFLAGTTTVGRLAFQSSDGQQLLPMNFVFRHGRVYFMTSPDSVLAELAAGCPDVAFEIDYPDRLLQHGWSVLVKGATREVAAADVDLSPRAPRPWAPGEREILIELTPAKISGRRIRNIL